MAYQIKEFRFRSKERKHVNKVENLYRNGEKRTLHTAQENKFSLKDFLIICDQYHTKRFLCSTIVVL